MKFYSQNKYRNKKTEIDGHRFDSKKEASRYLVLKLRQENGIISGLELQPVFELQPSFKRGSKTIRAIKYIADFMYQKKGQIYVEDVKGVKTAAYQIKKKMFLKRYPDFIFQEI